MSGTKEYERARWHRRQDRKKGADRNRVSGAPLKFSPKQQADLLIRVDRGDSFRDIAQVLNCSVSTVCRYAYGKYGREKRRPHGRSRIPNTRAAIGGGWWETGVDTGNTQEALD